jgi:hypothetical protein
VYQVTNLRLDASVIFYWWMVPVPDPNIDRVHGGYYFLSAGGLWVTQISFI